MRARFVSHRGLVSWSGGVAAGVAIAAGFGLHGRAQSAALFAPTALSSADYARAEKMLGPATNALVVNAAIRPTWASDTQFYRNAKADGSGDTILVDAAAKTRTVCPTTGCPGVTAPPEGAGARGGRGAGGQGRAGGGGRGTVGAGWPAAHRAVA